MVRILSSCEMEINFLTCSFRLVIMKEPFEFLHRRLPTRIALNPDESQYPVSVRSKIIFLYSCELIITSSVFNSEEIKLLSLSSLSLMRTYLSCLSVVNFIAVFLCFKITKFFSTAMQMNFSFECLIV